MREKSHYNFSDFTTSNYLKLLRIAKEKYRFRNYLNFNLKEKFIIWRHDIDFSVHRAKKIALLEHEEGIKSTYFINLHSEFYNLLEKEITDLVKDIIDLGHEIALHFDHHYYQINNKNQMKRYLSFEKEILEKLFKQRLKVFSFHLNNNFTKNYQEEEYAGLVNVYSMFFKEKINYCSDSNGYWRYKRLEDVLKDKEILHLQVLTHPGLWQEKPMSPKKRILRSIEGRAKKTEKWYDETLTKYGRKNI